MLKLFKGGKKDDPSPTAELMAAVLEGDSDAFRELLIRLRPKIRFLLADKYPWLGYVHRDLADQAETLLFDWWRRRGEGLLRPKESLAFLTFRLVAQVARGETRHQERKARLEDKINLDIRAVGHEPQMEETWSPEMLELFEDMEALPERHREVLWAEVRHERGEGPPPHEALGLTQEAARQRLHRARGALLLRIEKRDKETHDV